MVDFWSNGAIEITLLRNRVLVVTPSVGYLLLDQTENKTQANSKFYFDTGTRLNLKIESNILDSVIFGARFSSLKIYNGDILSKNSYLFFGGWLL